jgi:hypothetical protein
VASDCVDLFTITLTAQAKRGEAKKNGEIVNFLLFLSIYVQKSRNQQLEGEGVHHKPVGS